MSDADWIEKLLTTTGPLMAVFVLALWLLKTYLVKTAESHLGLNEVLKSTQQKIDINLAALKEHSAEVVASQEKLTERLIVNQEKLTESVTSQQQHIGHCKTTSSALLGLCDVIETAAKDHPNEVRIIAAMRPVKTILTTGK